MALNWIDVDEFWTSVRRKLNDLLAAQTVVPAPNGVDDTDAIQDAIDRSAAAGGGFVKLLAGIYRVSATLTLPTGVTLAGCGYGRFSTLGTQIRRIANVPLLTAIGISVLVQPNSQIYRSGVRDVFLHGGSLSYTADLTQFMAASGFLFDNVNFGYSGGRLLLAQEFFDSWFRNCRFEEGGKADGTIPAIELTSGGGYEFTNQIRFKDCIWESNKGIDLDITGTNTNEIYVDNAKMESYLSKALPLIRARNAGTLLFSRTQLTGGFNTTLDCYVDIQNCSYVDGDIRIEHQTATPLGYLARLDNVPFTNLHFASYGLNNQFTGTAMVWATGSSLLEQRLRVTADNPIGIQKVGGVAGGNFTDIVERLLLSNIGQAARLLFQRRENVAQNFNFRADLDATDLLLVLELNRSGVTTEIMRYLQNGEQKAGTSIRTPVVSVVAAGATQATATAISEIQGHVAVTSSTAGSADGVRLPSASEGRERFVKNATANPIKVYPASGQKIDAGTTDAAFTIPAGKEGKFVAQVGGSNWWSALSA